MVRIIYKFPFRVRPYFSKQLWIWSFQWSSLFSPFRNTISLGDTLYINQKVLNSSLLDTSYLELYAHRKQSTVMKVLFICHKFQLQFLHNIADKTPLMQLTFLLNWFFFSHFPRKVQILVIFQCSLSQKSLLLCNVSHESKKDWSRSIQMFVFLKSKYVYDHLCKCYITGRKS